METILTVLFFSLLIISRMKVVCQLAIEWRLRVNTYPTQN